MNTTHTGSSSTPSTPATHHSAQDISSKPPLLQLPQLATRIDCLPLPSDTKTSQVFSSPFLAAQMFAIADNPGRGRVPHRRDAWDGFSPLIHDTHTNTHESEVYPALGLGIMAPPSPTASFPTPPPLTLPQSQPESLPSPDHMQCSQPIQIEAHKPSADERQKEEGEPEDPTSSSYVALSPAMQFLNTMNSPTSCLSASPALSRVTSLSLPPTEPERIGPYTLGPVIASGGFSVIRKATSPTGVVAVKVVSTSSSPDSPSPALLDHEISIWSTLHHENVLPLFSSYRFPGTIYLVTLLCPEGSLLDVMRHHGHPALALEDAGTMFRQIVRGLKYLHEEAKVVHGDIKLENILLDEMGTCRIADFGLAQPIPPPGSILAPAKEKPYEPLSRSESVSSLPPHLRGRRPARRASSYVPPPPADVPSVPVIAPGSLPYAAPELLVQRARGAQPGAVQHIPHPAQDIWALGCVLHALLYGRLPFTDAYEPRLVDKILTGRWNHSPSSSRSQSRSRARGRAAGSWGEAARRSRSRGGALRSRDGVRIGAGAKRVLKGCLVVEAEKRWTIAQIHEVSILSILNAPTRRRTYCPAPPSNRSLGTSAGVNMTWRRRRLSSNRRLLPKVVYLPVFPLNHPIHLPSQTRNRKKTTLRTRAGGRR